MMIWDRFRRLDSNKLQYLPKGCLDKIPKLTKIKLDKNPWHCDCQSIYLARFLREHFAKLWNGIATGGPVCLGPGNWHFMLYWQFNIFLPIWLQRLRGTWREGGNWNLTIEKIAIKSFSQTMSNVGQRFTIRSSLLRTVACDGEFIAKASNKTASIWCHRNHWAINWWDQKGEKCH